MVFAWVLTMPAAALIGAAGEETIAASTETAGVVVVAAVAAAILALIFVLARRTNVTAHNVIEGIDVEETPKPALAPA
jgi:inorganic phosphate transporter, PiT family